MIKKDDIMKVFENFSVYYNGYNFSNEPIFKMFISYLSNTYKKEHNVGLVFEIDSIFFKVAVITVSYITNLLTNSYKLFDMVNDLEIGVKVLYKNKRYKFAGIKEIENTYLNPVKQKYILLINKDNGHEYKPIREMKFITPYLGDASSLGGRGVREDLDLKVKQCEELFGIELEMNPSILDNCTVLVMQREEAVEIMNKIEFRTKINKKIKFLDLATVSYFTENEEHSFGGNVAKSQPVIKVTSSIYNARKLVLNRELNKVNNLVVFGNEKIEQSLSMVEELMNSKSLYHMIMESHISTKSCDDVIDLYKDSEILALTKEFVNENEVEIVTRGHFFKEYENRLDVIKSRSIDFKNIGELIPITDYDNVRNLLFALRRTGTDHSDISNFIIQAYSLLKLFRTAVFTMKEFEDMIARNIVGQKSPAERIDALVSESIRLNEISSGKTIEIAKQLKVMHSMLFEESIMKNAVMKYISYNRKMKKIAIIVPYAYYQNILFELDIEKMVFGSVSIFTPNRFDCNKYFDEIVVIGESVGKKFNALRNYNGKKITIFGYNYEDRFIRYYAAKAEEFLNKVNRSKYIVDFTPNISIHEDIKAEIELTEFIRNELGKFNINNYMSSYSGISYSMTEVIAAATFTDGEKAFFTKGYSAYVFDNNRKVVTTKGIEKINSGDVLIFTKRGTLTQDIVDEMLIDLFDNKLLNDQELESYKMWDRWKRQLKQHVEINNYDYYRISKQFYKAGIEKHPFTIKSWIDSQYHVTGPIEKGIFEKIGKVINDEEMITSGDKYWNATSNIRKVKTKILKIIGESIIRELCGMKSTEPMYKRISDNTQKIADLLEIEVIKKIEPVQLQINMVNRPITL